MSTFFNLLLKRCLEEAILSTYNITQRENKKTFEKKKKSSVAYAKYFK